MARDDDFRSARGRGPGDRLISNFMADRRLRFVVYTIALGVVIFALVMFELPALFGIAFVGWWVVWTLQRDAADVYHELYEINEQLSGRKGDLRELLRSAAEERTEEK
jgi:hypothetical protein